MVSEGTDECVHALAMDRAQTNVSTLWRNAQGHEETSGTLIFVSKNNNSNVEMVAATKTPQEDRGSANRRVCAKAKTCHEEQVRGSTNEPTSTLFL